MKTHSWIEKHYPELIFLAISCACITLQITLRIFSYRAALFTAPQNALLQEELVLENSDVWMHGDEPIYEFPPAEVGANQFITLHLRTYPGQENCKDETGDNLALGYVTGAAADTSTSARDLWATTNQKFLHNSDVVYIMNQDDVIIDAVMFSDDKKSWDKNAALTKAAELLAKQSAWLDASGVQVKTPAFIDAASSTSTTTTRTLNRDKALQDTNTASDWFVSLTSGATPGAANKDRPE
ncbi:MAG: hypothetical protein Ta2G_10970 [Termitinemataceae bacterium]|nr:MAG: hypothetical protein Ta2G_10970 [Termitinemataceae bacterium]